jgi:hypothetical protein
MRLSRLIAVAVATVSLAVVVSPGPVGAYFHWNGPAGVDGFESGTLGGWTCEPGASIVTSPVYQGSRALAGAPSSTGNAECSRTITVYPAASYTISAWVRGRYVFLGVGGHAPVWQSGSTDGWHRLTLSFNAGKHQNSARIYLRGSLGRGYVADEVAVSYSCYSGPTPTATPPGGPIRPSLSPSPSPSPSGGPSESDTGNAPACPSLYWP